MSYQRLAYEDQDTTVKMHTDCTAAASEMGVPEQRVAAEVFGSPSLEIPVSQAVAAQAARMQLHLD
ncbi:MAG: hypothetical protein NTV23_05010 [Propionibacteriales bacterium]|nr:hypothetical protein [Propionibacteriales bacterium]